MGVGCTGGAGWWLALGQGREPASGRHYRITTRPGYRLPSVARHYRGISGLASAVGLFLPSMERQGGSDAGKQGGAYPVVVQEGLEAAVAFALLAQHELVDDQQGGHAD